MSEEACGSKIYTEINYFYVSPAYTLPIGCRAFLEGTTALVLLVQHRLGAKLIRSYSIIRMVLMKALEEGTRSEVKALEGGTRRQVAGGPNCANGTPFIGASLDF